jgi:hypothetical protein
MPEQHRVDEARRVEVGEIGDSEAVVGLLECARIAHELEGEAASLPFPLPRQRGASG